MLIAHILVWMAEAYLLIGFAIGAAFVVFGIDRIDASARGAYAFRPLLLPGLALLWPLVAARWWRAVRRSAGDAA
jgi:hypothetical protein